MRAEDEHVCQHGPKLANDAEATAPMAGSAAAGRAAPSNACKKARGGWHLNVEVSANTTANIKYLYYYTTKGADRNVASIRRDTDEHIDEVRIFQACQRMRTHEYNTSMVHSQVEEYLNARVYGPDSAAYQLFELPHHFQSHSCFVMKLSYPGREVVRFDPSQDERRILDAATAKKHLNHTQQYLTCNGQEAYMLFRPTEAEVQAAPRLGTANAIAGENQARQPDGPAEATQGAAHQRAPHEPRARATPEEERAELHQRAAEARAPRRGAWAYRVLGVMRDATAAVLKQAFRHLSLRLHPDKNTHADKDAASAAFRNLRDAYEQVGTPENRAQFDALHGEDNDGSDGANCANVHGDGLSAAERAEILIDITGVQRRRTPGWVPCQRGGRTLTRAQYLGVDERGELLLPMAALTYDKVPYYYRWVGRTWQRRCKPHFAADIVGRVHNLTPKAGDAFYMRLLLMSPGCVGACSHEELRTPCRHSGERPLGAHVRVLNTAAGDVSVDTTAVPVGATGTIVGFSNDGHRRVVRVTNGNACASFAPEHLQVLPCATYKHACQLQGLLDDDSLWRATMCDGVGTMRPAQLRDLFVSILLYSDVGDARVLWEEFRDDMSADFARRRGDELGLNELDPVCDESDYNCTLGELHDKLHRNGALLEDYGLPPYDAARDRRGRNAEQRAEYYDNEGELRERWIEGIANFNADQRKAWEALRADVHEVWEVDQSERAANRQTPLRPKLHFVWGRGGSGKTFLDQVLLDYVRSGGENRVDRRVALAVASSGIAALLLEGGRTVHSRFKIPINLQDPTVRANVKAQSNLAALLREATLILWDEATMLSKEAHIAPFPISLNISCFSPLCVSHPHPHFCMLCRSWSCSMHFSAMSCKIRCYLAEKWLCSQAIGAKRYQSREAVPTRSTQHTFMLTNFGPLFACTSSR